MIISVQNNLDTGAQYSYTSVSNSSGGTILPIKNINSFTQGWAIQVGKSGEEQTEIVNLDASTGTSAGTALYTTGTTRFNHSQDVPVYNIHFDKVIIKRSTVGTAGTATALSNGTINITPDSLYTTFNDATGASTYAYKTQFYSSVTGDVSSESDWFVPGGPTFYSLQKLRQRVKDNLFSAGYLKDDSVINDWINECLEDLNNSAIKVNKGYALGTAAYSFDSTGLGTVTSADFKQAVKFEVSFDGGVNYTQSKEIPINQFSNSDIYTSVYPCHYWAGDSVFGIRPAQNGGTAKITYAKIYTKLINDGDELPPPLRNYTIAFQEWALWRAYGNDQKREYANDHLEIYNQKKGDFISEITPRDQTGPKTIQFDDTLSGRADDFDLEYFAI